MTPEEHQKYFEDFYEDIFRECEACYGEIEEMNVCDNAGDHLLGNVYIKFKHEEDAEKVGAPRSPRGGARPTAAHRRIRPRCIGERP